MTSTTLFQKPRFGLTSDSELKLRSQESLRPPSSDICHSSGSGCRGLDFGDAQCGHSSSATPATIRAARRHCRRFRT